MLKAAERQEGGFRSEGGFEREQNSELDYLLAAARRQFRVVVASSILAFIAGLGYIATTLPLYTASSVLLIDNRRLRAVQDSYDIAPGGLEQASALDSQVELLRSERIGLAVVEKLQLNRDQDFLRPAESRTARFLSLLGIANSDDAATASKSAETPPTEDNVEQGRLTALGLVQGNVDVKRVPRTLVLEISYRSSDPAKAAVIANAYADAYLVDQLDAKYEATRRASSWLLDRMAELKQQVLTSDLAIQKFKADNDLVAAGGKLLNEQQLGEVNSALVTSRAETAKAEARYARIKAIIDSRQTDAVVTEAIGNAAIEQLRSKFLVAAKRESELSSRLGPTHGAVASLRAEMREYERLMFDELGRIAESYLSELVIAQAREKSLRGSMQGLVGINASANETAVALRELEREAETFRTLYQSFLQRYQEAVQQQSFPITEARIITSARPPGAPSHPRKTTILALSLILGAGAGVCLGALRELRDRTFRTEEQAREELPVEFLGVLPLIATRRGRGKAKALSATEAPTDPQWEAGKRFLGEQPPIMRHGLDNPLSNFVETLRATKIAADLTMPGRSPRTIGIVSILPDEGKSTVAKNLGSLLANLGASTLLIDADLRNPGLTRAVAPQAEAGLVQAVLDGTPLKDLLLYERDSKLAVLPAVLQRRLPHTADFLTSPGMRSVLKQAEEDFEWILLDLPPMGPVVDVRAIASRIDAFALVVEWGRTSRKLVRATLQAEPQLRDKCLGVIFNKVNLRKLKLYEAYGSKSYYSGEYKNYYREGQ